MKLAAKRLEGIGWLLLVFLVAVLLYPLSLSVATLRSDLARTDQKIVSVKKEIRYLETEFSARANLRQLEQWNKLEYGYVAPKAAQYLEGERALASLGGSVPRGPVKIAMINAMDDARPAGIIGSVIPTASAQTLSPAEEASSTTPVEESSDSELQQNVQNPSNLNENRTERVASMEKKLLDDGLMRDLTVKADREQTRSNGG